MPIQMHTGSSNTKPRLLWSGTWTSGSISVPDASKYSILIFVNNYGTASGIVLGNSINAFGIKNDTDDQVTCAIAATISASGNTISLTNAYALRHTSGSDHATVATITITAIYGIR